MKTKILLSFAVVTAFLLGSVSAFSQCPSDSLPGGSPYMGPWIKDSCVIIMVPKYNDPTDSCPYSVCYCYRIGGLTAPFVEIYVYGASIVPPGCNPFGGGVNQDIILGKEILKKNPKNRDWTCPPCSNGSGAPNRRVMITGCRSTTPPYISCDAGCCFYCAYDYVICCDNDGKKHLTFIQQTTVGTAVCPSGCQIGPCDVEP
jgi:hypothetical protein